MRGIMLWWRASTRGTPSEASQGGQRRTRRRLHFSRSRCCCCSCCSRCCWFHRESGSSRREKYSTRCLYLASGKRERQKVDRRYHKLAAPSQRQNHLSEKTKTSVPRRKPDDPADIPVNGEAVFSYPGLSSALLPATSRRLESHSRSATRWGLVSAFTSECDRVEKKTKNRGSRWLRCVVRLVVRYRNFVQS